MRIMTAGESHGFGLYAIMEGLPSGFKIDLDAVNIALSKRQNLYGRGKRMKIESDKIEITAGLIDGITYGAPICIFIGNKDDRTNLKREKITVPRPGHSDLVGCLKYDLSDCSIPSEYSGGRITAVYTALGEIARQFLKLFDIDVLGFVKAIKDIQYAVDFENINLEHLRNIADDSDLRVCDPSVEAGMKKIIDEAASEGETLGGLISVIVLGVPVGLGCFSPFYKRLDSIIASYIMAVPAIKGVEFGEGFNTRLYKGSELQDALYKNGNIKRKTNHAGGIEGGFSNGEPIIVNAVMKPLPSVKKGISSFDIESEMDCKTIYVRSDICAVPACALALQSFCSAAILEAFMDKFYSDTLNEIVLNYNRYTERIKNA